MHKDIYQHHKYPKIGSVLQERTKSDHVIAESMPVISVQPVTLSMSDSPESMPVISVQPVISSMSESPDSIPVISVQPVTLSMSESSEGTQSLGTPVANENNGDEKSETDVQPHLQSQDNYSLSNTNLVKKLVHEDKRTEVFDVVQQPYEHAGPENRQKCEQSQNQCIGEGEPVMNEQQCACPNIDINMAGGETCDSKEKDDKTSTANIEEDLTVII